MKKAPYIILAIAILVVVGIYFYQKGAKPAQAPVAENTKTLTQTSIPNQTATTTASQQVMQPTSTKKTITTPSGTQAQGTFSSGENEAGSPNIQVVEVDFDGSKFTPSPVTINTNDWVFFKNKSSTGMWVASNPHPTHTDYPGFDAKQSIAPGGEYKFQFTKAGTWGYHDHLNPSIGGTVIVK